MAKSAVQTRTAKSTVSRKKLQEIRTLKRQALEYYELASNDELDALTVELRLQQARSSVALALKYNPVDSDALNLFSRISLELGNAQDAREAIKQALDVHPRNGGYWYSLGHVELAEQNLDAAETSFRKAIKYAAKETKADHFLAYTLQAKGEAVEAFQLYRELAKTRSSDPHIKSKLFESANNLTADYYDPELDHDLITYLGWEDTHCRNLSSIVCSLLEHKFQISEAGCGAESDTIAYDPLFLLALKKLPIKSGGLEKLIMALRYELLLGATHQGQVANSYIPLAAVISMYGHRSEFILPMTDAEKNMVEALRNLIDSAVQESVSTPKDIAGALLLYSMYDSWHKLATHDQVIALNENLWPEYLRELYNEYQQLAHHQALTIDSLTEISSGTSEKVKEQYESYPYPRWGSLDYKRRTHYSQALQQEYGNIRFPKYLNEDSIKVLIAGCGTGRHALHVAKYFRNVDVTAIDLSQASLCYAKGKAQEFDVTNIQFYQADLLNLDQLEDSFHIIECSGVLHHIKESELALKNLLSVLKPDGLIKIALYSERARTPVKNIRTLFKRDDASLNPNRIKMIRQAILSSTNMPGKEQLIQSDDFYSVSGTVDLLFHQYEKRYTPVSIKELLEKHELTFLGFSGLSHSVRQAFHQFIGKDADMLNLDQWDRFEESHPNTFSKMFQFYCQKK